jgi:hypothetical protein
MRHIDDLKFELVACLERAVKLNDYALVNGVSFCLNTLDKLSRDLKEGVEDENL